MKRCKGNIRWVAAGGCVGLLAVAFLVAHFGFGWLGRGPQARLFNLPLRAAVYHTLDRSSGPVFRSELNRMRELRSGSEFIEMLAGIEAMPNLERLYLDANLISDLAPLEHLGSLKVLSYNDIVDVTPLGTLQCLTSLDVTANSIEDVSPLGALVRLHTLELGQNRIVDLGGLTNLSSLTSLKLNDNRITDIAPLSTLVTLKSLNLGGNRVVDLSSLAPLIELEKLSLT